MGGNLSPQFLQNLASSSSPSFRQAGQARVVTSLALRCMVISELIMPVGTARMPQPSNIISDEMARPMSVFGAISPKPTVVMVLMAQYMAVGILVKPLSGPSTTYITVPNKNTTIITNDKKIKILRLLAIKARPSTVYSCT